MKLPIFLCLLAASPLIAAGNSRKSDAKTEKQEIITIGGQVRRPGPVEVREKLTLYAAIQSAGGATEFGAMRRVKVYRGDEVLTYDLTKKENMKVLVEADDTIEVPQKNWIGR